MTFCEYCRKKTGLIPFSCKCNYKNLCTKCRLPFDHNCSWDFKTEGQKNLEKELCLAKVDKVIKI